LGAKVVLADVRPDLPILDVSRVRDKITPRTKAILPVHLNGRAADMEALTCLAEKHGLCVVEDACQAIFSRSGRGYLGTQAHAGCYSLGVTKLISTGQGGCVATRDKATYERLRLIRNHGVSDTFSADYRYLGFNFKFTDILASMGLAQLAQVESHIRHVTAVYERYTDAIARLPFMKVVPVDVRAGEVPLYVEVLCERRDSLLAFLQAHGIQARPFHPSLSRSPHLREGSELSNSRKFDEQGLTLPCGPHQPLANVDPCDRGPAPFRQGEGIVCL
jgi:dTDP-4-amino-4,6-dideoxygalactose transaminase